MGDVAGASTSEYQHVEVFPDDTVLAGGRADGQLLLSRYGSTGSPISAFDADGHLRHPTITWSLRDSAWMDGRFVVVGDYGDARIARVNADGTLDGSFSGDGLDDPAVPGSSNDNGLLLLGDGRAMLLGGDGTRAQARMYGAASVPDHADGVADWNDGSGFFGACLRAVGATGAATWPTSGTCPASDGTFWNDVQRTPEIVATSASGATGTVASLRFGMRVPSAQAPGSYVAPIRVEVYAPAT